MMIDEFLAKYNEKIGERKLALLANLENHPFKDFAEVNAIRGQIWGLNHAHAVLRDLYDGIYKPKESVVVTNEGIKDDEKPAKY